jgi:hypothetical protein
MLKIFSAKNTLIAIWRGILPGIKVSLNDPPVCSYDNRAWPFRWFCNTTKVWLTRGYLGVYSTLGQAQGLPWGRHPKVGTPPLKPVIGVYSMQSPGNWGLWLKDDNLQPPGRHPQLSPDHPGFQPHTYD